MPALDPRRARSGPWHQTRTGAVDPPPPATVLRRARPVDRRRRENLQLLDAIRSPARLHDRVDARRAESRARRATGCSRGKPGSTRFLVRPFHADEFTAPSPRCFGRAVPRERARALPPSRGGGSVDRSPLTDSKAPAVCQRAEDGGSTCSTWSAGPGSSTRWTRRRACPRLDELLERDAAHALARAAP